MSILHAILAGISTIFFLAAFILLLPLKNHQKINIPGKLNRIDERDAIFHRFYRLTPGTVSFAEFYKQHPEKLQMDQQIRQMPNLAEPGTSYYSASSSPYALSVYDILGKINQNLDFTETEKSAYPLSLDAENLTERIKGFAHHLGADLTGIARLNPGYVYSHIGRSPGKWGSPIHLNHPFAIALAVEMNHHMIGLAPDVPALTETAIRYFTVTTIALVLARYIQRLGYMARAHVDANYRVLCVPIAVDAGLGELGRHGLLITPRFGSRVRLAVITTDMPLITDSPVAFGVQDFCGYCRKCADSCPSGAINSKGKQEINGVKKWQSSQEACYRQWRIFGTDCGLCIRVCPYSHPGSGFHNFVRWIIKRNMLARRLAFYADKLIYSEPVSAKKDIPAWHQ